MNLVLDSLHLADRFRFSLYDAAYLELAQRQIFVLAGFDLSGNTLAVAPRRRRLIRWLLDRRENLKSFRG